MARLTHLLLLLVLVAVILETTEGGKKKKSKRKKNDDEGEEEEGGDEAGGGGGGDGSGGKKKGGGDEEEQENAAGKKMQEDLKKLFDAWKNFKMPDAFGSASFLDMHNCLSHSMNKGMSGHPDIGLNLAEVIEAHGYPVEKFKVETSDGYKLTLHRIEYSPKSPLDKKTKKLPVLLNHGLGGNGHEWVLQWNEKSLAYLLADKGYDVWISNQRGTRYARKHNEKTSKDDEFWDFSFDELGRYELPAVIDVILKETEQIDLFYVGHGLGTTAYVVAMTEVPEYNKKIKKAIFLGPSVFMGHSKSFFRTMAPLAKDGQYKKSPVLGGKGETAQDQLKGFDLKDQYNKACKPAVFHCFGCSSMYFTIGGFNAEETNYTQLPLISSLFPDKISTKTLVHYAQTIVTSKFQQFDYGSPEENQKVYQVDAPPDYDLSKLTSPISIFYAEKDYMSPPEDVEFTATQFPAEVMKDLIKVDSEGFTSGDFVTAIHARKLVYDPLIRILKGESLKEPEKEEKEGKEGKEDKKKKKGKKGGDDD